MVQPLYQGSPAPTGLADYGLSVAPNGSLVASVLNTTSVLGVVDANATGIQPLDLYNTEPDAYGLQLNAVLTDTVLFGRPGYDFWTQNVFEYFPSLRTMFLITNIWNFSGNPYYLGPAIYQHGLMNGGVYGYVYESLVDFTNISYPFDLSLYLNSTLVGGRDAVDFAAVLAGPGESVNLQAPYDYVVFNSTSPGGSPLSAPAEFSANGVAYNPEGLTSDFELDFGGPGSGSQADLVAADAELGLAYWDPAADGGAGGYVSVPSAFNYGGETGETSTGATVTWSNAPAGPGGLSPYGTMATGPSILAGLWNASGPEGSYPVTIHSSPANAFEVVTPAVTVPWTSLTESLASAPSMRSQYQEAYSPALGETILFGGYSPATQTALNDTWAFSSRGWTDVSARGSPPARFYGALVYDAADGYLVLFGGKAVANGYTTRASDFLNDTWIYTATGWHELFPAHAPSPRGWFAMAYDAADSEVVLFGGGIGSIRSQFVMYDDTWTFHAGQWTNITSTAGTPPPPRVYAGVAYDAADGYLLLVGGASTGELAGVACPFDLAGQWRFSGGRWSGFAPTGAVPPAGSGSLWFDSTTDITYYYEGLENLTATGGDCQSFVGDVWSYAAGAWQLLAPGGGSRGPTPRYFATIVDDAAAHVELLFGGQDGWEGPFYDDTWVFDPNASVPAAVTLPVPAPSVGPTVTTDTFWLAPGNYTLETELSGYDPVLTDLNVTSNPLTVYENLVADPSIGIYTPLWAWSDAQVATLSTSGTGTPSDPYVLENDQPGPIGPVFGLFNDYSYPVYPGIFLLDTDVSIDVLHPPEFNADMIGAEMSSEFMNALPLWFWNVTGVALAGGAAIGLGETDLSELSPFAVVFYDSQCNLLADNRFTALDGNVLMETGPSAGPFTGTGGNNTIWGNTFASGAMGLVEVESNDLIYNNNFSTERTACQPGNPSLPNYCWSAYSLTPVSLSNRWNISVRPASAVIELADFPNFPLSGSILETTWQGGNYWRDYGTYPNEYGVLPYDENVSSPPYYELVYITPGGDYAPLVRGTLYNVTFAATGVPPGDSWGLSVRQAPFYNTLYDWFTTTALQYSILLPNCTALLEYLPPPGRVAGGSSPTRVTVAGENLTVKVTFTFEASVWFLESGLPPGVLAKSGWMVELNGIPTWTQANVVTLEVAGGTYPLLITGPSGYTTTENGSLAVTTALAFVNVTFVPGPTLTLGFAAKGLPRGQSWCVEVDGYAQCTAKGNLAYDDLPTGAYNYSVLSPLSGQQITARVGSTAISPSGSLTVERRETIALTFVYRYAVTFSETGLSSGTWSVAIDGRVGTAPAGEPILLELPNGTYPGYKIGPEAGYTGRGSPRSLAIHGAPGSVTVVFTLIKPHPTLYTPVRSTATPRPVPFERALQIRSRAPGGP
jgi:hypothetical protein